MCGFSTANWNLLKLHRNEFAVTFLSYPEFDTDPHPALAEATKINLNTGSVIHIDYRERANPPILHRKESFLDPKDPRAAKYSALTTREEKAGLYQNSSKIGLRIHWLTLLKRAGLTHDGHELVPIRKEVIETPVSETDACEIHRYRTAIKRYDLSKPVKQLLERGLLKKGDTFFDFGCGHGMDITALQFSAPVIRERRRLDRFELHRELFEEFWQSIVEPGRVPESGEFDRLSDVARAAGGMKRAFALVISRQGEQLLKKTRAARTEDVLVYLAMTKLRRRFLHREIPLRIKNDIRSFFGDFAHAQAKAKDLLFAAGDPDEIDLACENLDVGWQDKDSLMIHRSLLGELPPILLALAAYTNENSNWDLLLDASGRSIAWRKRDLVEAALALNNSYSPETALSCFSRLFSSSSVESGYHKDSIAYSLEDLNESDGIIPRRLLVAAWASPPTAELVRKVASLSLEKVSESRMAILLSAHAPDEETAAVLRRLQSSLTSNVVVMHSGQLLESARIKDAPRNTLARQLLEQSDLIKASPFVVNSVTPNRMFYGRETEEADMVATLRSNSIALLGGRRIGKTSLMRHVDARLKDGGFTTFFCDCQTVRDWNDFAAMARRIWGVTVDEQFRPTYLFELVRQLKPSPNSKVVILLDEIDQLLDWDKRHAEDQVPEAFFRACRTISQETEAQFVFSGERTIAGRLWDAESPHWNFCQPLMLRQLDRSAASQLLIKPLHFMQILTEDEEAFSIVAWDRTSGHPQLLQTLGDRLVRQLNERPPSARATVSSKDLTDIADVHSYAEHYLETYWGQATDLERLLSLLVATGIDKLESCRDFLRESDITRSDVEIRSGLRMLEMYGITDSIEAGYRMRLEWFVDAIGFYGTAEKLIKETKSKLK